VLFAKAKGGSPAFAASPRQAPRQAHVDRTPRTADLGPRASH